MANGELVATARTLDDKILAMAGHMSPEEISAELKGTVSAKRIAAHVQTLLKSRDWLTLAQQDQLVTNRLQKMLHEFEQRYMDVDNAKVMLSLLKEIGNRLDKRQAATQVDLNSLYNNQARLMAQAINLAFERALFELQKRVPELEEAEVREVLADALPKAIEVIEARNEGDPIE